MNIILAGYSAIFIASFIIDYKNKDYFFKAFLFNIIIIMYFIITKKTESSVLFILSESLFLLLAIFNNKANHKIFLPIFYSGIILFSLKFILPYVYLKYLISIFILLIIVNFFLLKNEDKNFKIFYILYFISTFSMLYSEFNYEMLISLMIFKLLLIYFFINMTLKDHKIEFDKIIERNKILEKSFEKSVRFEAQKRTISLERINSKALEKAKTDKLTSTLNKEGIINKIDSFILDKRIKTFSLLFFDIDKFKTINDTYGHNIGDKALKCLADSVFDIKRDEDFFGRYGGDEFIILLKNTTTTEANMIANRYREYVKENSKPKFSISIGFSTFPNDGVTVKSLLEIADNGLYASKERGRDKVSYTGMNKILN